MAGHDADLDLVGRDQAGAIGAQQEGFLPAGGHLGFHPVAHLEHVAHGDAFGDADGEVEIRFDGLPDRRCGAGRRYVDHAHGRPGLRLGLLHAGEDGNPFEVLARLLRIHAGDEAVAPVGVVTAHARMELTGLAGDALRDDLGVFVDQDGHELFSSRLAGRRRRRGALRMSTT
jgi:hypothetical protein